MTNSEQHKDRTVRRLFWTLTEGTPLRFQGLRIHLRQAWTPKGGKARAKILLEIEEWIRLDRETPEPRCPDCNGVLTPHSDDPCVCDAARELIKRLKD